jgi:hypothetical protein
MIDLGLKSAPKYHKIQQGDMAVDNATMTRL